MHSGFGCGLCLFVMRNSRMTNGVCLSVLFVMAHARAMVGTSDRRSSSRFNCIMNDHFDDIYAHDSLSRCRCDSCYGRARAGLMCRDNVSMGETRGELFVSGTFQW